MAASRAVTVKLNATAVVALAGATTANWVAAPGLTVMVAVPVMAAVTVSVAVMVREPAVLNVTARVATPRVNVKSAGSTARPSLLVRWAVPAYVVAVLPKVSRAVTVMLNAVPLVAVTGAVTRKLVAAAAATVIERDPVMDAVTVSVAVTLRAPAVFRVADRPALTPLSAARKV